MTLPGERRDSNAGFTLLELVVVLALLAAMVAMIIPSLGHALSQNTLRAAATELRAALRAAGTQAVTEGRTIVFRAEAGAGYRLDDAYHRVATAGDPALQLRIVVADNATISFYPWGGSSGGRIWIDSAAGRREIDVDTVNGRAVLRP